MIRNVTNSPASFWQTNLQSTMNSGGGLWPKKFRELSKTSLNTTDAQKRKDYERDRRPDRRKSIGNLSAVRF